MRICVKKKRDWEKEQRERERERQQRERERERQQRERERQREQERRDRERAQREREKAQREKDRQQREREKQQRIAREAQEIYEGLKRYTEERMSVQERQRRHWGEVYHGVSRKEELREDRGEIGRINNEINKLIGRLTRYPKQYSCYKLAMDHLEREIERCAKIRDDRSEHIRKVARGEATWITSSGREHTDNTNQIEYVAHLEDKIRRYKEQLSKLRELNRQ